MQISLKDKKTFGPARAAGSDRRQRQSTAQGRVVSGGGLTAVPRGAEAAEWGRPAGQPEVGRTGENGRVGQ
jgi:hypothetical protein